MGRSSRHGVVIKSGTMVEKLASATGVAWFCFKSPTRFAEVLVVASPCPLILSACFVAGMGRSSRHGVVIKSGTMVEKLASAKRLRLIKQARLRKDNFLLIKSNQSMLE